MVGSRLFTFAIDRQTGNGICENCGFTATLAELLTILHISAHYLPESLRGAQISPQVTQVQAEQPAPEPKKEELIDTSRFSPIAIDQLTKTLGLTIKHDEENKLIAFLGELSAYTESSQLNISFNAPSSTGKSYIPTEIARLFPKEDVIEVGYCSPTAFFHDIGKYEKAKEGYTVDLSRKILIFLDQPHTLLLQHLRPLLSHDKKEILLKVADKSQKAGIKTKNIFLKGFPAVIFCTAGLKIDEQESTRFILLSPQTNPEKIREAIYEKIKKETDSASYRSLLNENPERKHLQERIRAIRQAHIEDVQISNPKKIEELFFSKNKNLKPRHQRDIGRIISLIKAIALLNLWFREKNGSVIIANDADIEAAFKTWNGISDSQEFNLPPYIYQLYKEVILPAALDKNGSNGDEEFTLGLQRKDVTQKHMQVYGRVLPDWLLRQQILPMLENAGLIRQEPDPEDRRKVLIYPNPTSSLTIPDVKNNSESDGGVQPENEPAKPDNTGQNQKIEDTKI
jgi:hypothetical protein